MINFPSHTSPLPKCLVQGQVVTKIRNQSKGCPRRDFRGGPVNFSSKEQVSFNFVTAVTIYSDFGVPKNKACHCFPIYLP